MTGAREKEPFLSACLIVRNEARFLAGCLESLQCVADEVVVVDTGSTDRTPEIARAAGARVFHEAWKEDFSTARNAALDRARGAWILVLDADERLEWEGGAEAFKKPLREEGRLAFVLPLVNEGLGKGEGGTSLVVRLFRNLPGIRYEGIIHERVEPSLAALAGGGLDGAVGRHAARIRHFGYKPEVRKERGKDDRDLRLLRRQMERSPRDPFFLYKFAAHPKVAAEHGEEADQAVKRAWELLLEQDPEGTRFAFTPEVAALHLLSLLSRRWFEAAEALAARAARFPPLSPNLAYALGKAALLSGRPGEAERHFQRARSFAGAVLPYAPFEGVAGFVSLLASSEAAYLQADRERAERLFREAESSASRPVANAFFGPLEVLVEKGNSALAARLLARAAEQDPADPLPRARMRALVEAVRALHLHPEAARIPS